MCLYMRVCLWKGLSLKVDRLSTTVRLVYDNPEYNGLSIAAESARVITRGSGDEIAGSSVV